jgi:hypothetical protein
MKSVGMSIVVLLSLGLVRISFDAGTFVARNILQLVLPIRLARSVPVHYFKSVTFTYQKSSSSTYMGHASHCGNTLEHTSPFPVSRHQYTRNEQLLGVPLGQIRTRSDISFVFPTFGRLSKRIPLLGENITSPFGPRPPYIPFKNWRIPFSSLIRGSTSPLARCN